MKKFRVWDEESKQMINPDPLSHQRFLIDSNGYLCGIDLTTFTWMGILPSGRYKVQWETGLKDKNGREIYEGDIVKATSGLIGDKYDGFTGIVKFECAEFMLENFKGDDGICLWSDVRELEVLGNIYENPELLGG